MSDIMTQDPAPSAAIFPVNSTVELLLQLLKQASLISIPMQDGVADPNEISSNELKIMMCLAGEGPIAGHDISHIMAIPPMNVSRSLAALQARGWLEHVRDPGNRRRKPVKLSKAGWQGYRAMIPDVAQVAEALLGTLSANDLRSLARITARIISNLETWETTHHKREA
jgi:DNA-binding MarR family transcriptional regulator